MKTHRAGWPEPASVLTRRTGSSTISTEPTHGSVVHAEKAAVSARICLYASRVKRYVQL